MAHKTTRISDIARRAGVSPATVSLVLNNRKGISSAVVDRVQQIAFEMGYHKGLNPKLQSCDIIARVCILQIRKHGGFIESQVANPESFIAGIVDYSSKLEGDQALHLEIRNTNWDLPSIRKAIDSISNHPMAHVPDKGKAADEANEVQRRDEIKNGVLVVATELNPDEISLLALSSQWPCVFIDAPYPHLPYDFVNMNNINAMYDIVGHLKEQGYRRFAYIHSEPMLANCTMRVGAMRQAMQRYRLEAKLHLLGMALKGQEDGILAEHLTELSRQLGPEFPDAFICSNDIQAYHVIKVLQKMGLEIPKDAGVVGFENLVSSAFFSPPLSSVAVPRREVGMRALKRLLEKMQVGEIQTKSVPVGQELSCCFIARQSSNRS